MKIVSASGMRSTFPERAISQEDADRFRDKVIADLQSMGMLQTPEEVEAFIERGKREAAKLLAAADAIAAERKAGGP